MIDVHKAQSLYDATRYWFTVVPPFLFVPSLIIDAPFGRFALKKSIFELDGIRSWICMELVSLAMFLATYLRSPLAPYATGTHPPLTPTHPPTLLAGLFVVHYLNRGLVSPLRTPSRSKNHLLVVASAVAFNLCNGSLMGAYLSSPPAAGFLADALARPRFWAGVALWAAGFAGNIAHDEVLLNIRRHARKGKGRASATDGNSYGSAGDGDNNGKDKAAGEHYAVPHGLLYRYISFPNYFCEWCEWLGFALAAAPPPSVASVGEFLGTMTPPWLFLINEVLLMLPRAYKGHRWYHARFPDYPKERKIVIPSLL